MLTQRARFETSYRQLVCFSCKRTKFQNALVKPVSFTARECRYRFFPLLNARETFSDKDAPSSRIVKG